MTTNAPNISNAESALDGAIAKLGDTALKIKADRDRLYDGLDNLCAAVQYAKVELEGCSDIDDEGRPNWAMKLLQVAEACEKSL